MSAIYIIREMTEILFLIIGLKNLCDVSCVTYQFKQQAFANIVLAAVWSVLSIVLYEHQEIFLFMRFLILCIYLLYGYKRCFVDALMKCVVLLVSVDVLSFIFAFATYPLAWVFQLEKTQLVSWLVAVSIHVLCYFIVLILSLMRKPIIYWSYLGSAKKGIFIIGMVVEIAFVGLKTASYNKEDTIVYFLFGAFIVFGITILTLWLRDRKKQHDKFSELIKYEHRTREIIPAIEKALQDLKNMGLSKAEEQRMIAELEAICKSSRSSLRGRDRKVRSFETTGSPILDNQLEQFVEECEQNGILLDVIVRAEITAFMELEDVEILTVLQIVGDLYRNAFKAVSKNKEKKNLLICFGYNADDYYEIGIYDNGHPFPPQIKEQLGVRGVTVDGTGHGMADIFEHLHRHQASFVLEENPAKGITFTKGIHIVFDEKDRIEI